MSVTNLSKKSKIYKKFAGLVDDRKSKLAKEFHHEIFPMKPDVFEGELALVVKDYANEVLSALIADTSNEKWAVLQFCILLWSESMGKTDPKLDDIIKFSLNSKPEEGMIILVLAMFSSGTFKSFELNLDQQVLFTTAALSLIVSTAPYLYHEIQTIRRNELWAHGGQVFTLALGDRFLPSHFCWTRLRNLVQVLLDGVLKNYMPDLVHHLGYPYASTKSSSPDPRIMEALATPYMNLIVQQPLPAWLSILKFKLHTDIPHDGKANEPYKLIWHSAVGMVCQVALRHAAESDLKLTVVEPKWGWSVLQRWLQDSSFRLFWHEQEDKDIQSLCQILNNVRSDTLQEKGVIRVIHFMRGFVQRCLVNTQNVDWNLICAATIHVFQCILQSINESSISTFEKLALSESFATLFLVIPLTSNPTQYLSQIENIHGTFFVDYIIERWSDITHSAFLLNMNANDNINVSKLEQFNLSNFKIFNELEYFKVEEKTMIGDPTWRANWYYPYNLLSLNKQGDKNNDKSSVVYLLMDFFAKSHSIKSSLTAKRIICKTQMKMLIRVVLAAWSTQKPQLFEHGTLLMDKYIFNNSTESLELLFNQPDTAAPILFIFDLYVQLQGQSFINKITSTIAATNTPTTLLLKAIFCAPSDALSNADALVNEFPIPILDTALYARISKHVLLISTKLMDKQLEFILKYIALYEAHDKEIMSIDNIPLICHSLKSLALFAFKHPSAITTILQHTLLTVHCEHLEIIHASVDLCVSLFYTCPLTNAHLSLLIHLLTEQLEEQVSILLIDKLLETSRTRLIEKISFTLVEIANASQLQIPLLLPVLHSLHSLSLLPQLDPLITTPQAPLPYKHQHIGAEMKQLSLVATSTLIHLYHKSDVYEPLTKVPKKCISLPKSILLFTNEHKSRVHVKTLFNSSQLEVMDVYNKSRIQQMPSVQPQSATSPLKKQRVQFKRNPVELVVNALTRHGKTLLDVNPIDFNKDGLPYVDQFKVHLDQLEQEPFKEEEMKEPIRETTIRESVIQESDGAEENSDAMNRFLVQCNITNTTTFKQRQMLYSDDLTYIQKMMKNVDKSYGREINKVALLFVNSATETDIFNNGKYSEAYKQFGDKLAPVINCKEYSGYMGGLEEEEEDKCRIMTTGNQEIVIHDIQLIRNRGVGYLKKHVGNDGIHVVWDEGKIPYTPWTISGDFGDVVIVVRPMGDRGMVTVYKKKGIPNIGPLEGTSVMGLEELPEMVMMTIVLALNRMNGKTWIDSKQEKLFPHKNREACIQYYREKFFTGSKIEDMVNTLGLSTWHGK